MNFQKNNNPESSSKKICSTPLPKEFIQSSVSHFAPEAYITPQKNQVQPDICRKKHKSAKVSNKRPFYLDSGLLDLYDLPPYARQRMISWLMQQGSKRCLQRQTCAFSIYLMDSYFMKHGSVNVSNIQQLGIACLNLGCKYSQSFIMPIKSNPALFSQQSIYNFQLTILKQNKFYLNTPNYSRIAQHLVSMWMAFPWQQKQLQIASVFQTQKSLIISNENLHNSKVSQFYELLDCCIMCNPILQYQIKDIVYNAFIVFIQKQSDPAFIQQNKQLIQQKLVKIFQQDAEYMRYNQFQFNQITFDKPIQTMIQFIYECLLKYRVKANLVPSSQTSMLNQFPIYANMSPLQKCNFQSWQSYYTKVAKQCASTLAQLQKQFQI